MRHLYAERRRQLQRLKKSGCEVLVCAHGDAKLSQVRIWPLFGRQNRILLWSGTGCKSAGFTPSVVRIHSCPCREGLSQPDIIGQKKAWIAFFVGEDLIN